MLSFYKYHFIIWRKGNWFLKTNITLLLPLSSYKKKLTRELAHKLDMFFVDVEDMLQFELVDLKRALSINGKDYLEKEENKLVARLYSYTNALITLNLSTFFKEQNNKLIKENSLIVYFEFSTANYFKLLKKEQKGDELELNFKLFEERNKLLKNNADIVVNCQNTNKKDIIKLLLQKINNYYLKKGK